MRVLAYGLNFSHKPGEFCLRSKYGYYFISHFRTDFVIEVEGRLVRGHAGDVYIASPDTVIYHGPTEEMQDGFLNDWMYLEGDDVDDLLEKYPNANCEVLDMVKESVTEKYDAALDCMGLHMLVTDNDRKNYLFL